MEKQKFEKIINKYLDIILSVSDGWRINQNRDNLNQNIYEIKDSDSKYSSFILDEYNFLSAKLIKEIIIELLKENNIHYDDLTIFSNNRKNGLDSKNRFYIFIKEDNFLYVFKEFGIQNHLNKNCLKLPDNYKTLQYAYISYVTENAWSEVINYNNDINDESKGTHVFSIKYFFNKYFSSEDFNYFCEYIEIYKNKFRNYLGLNTIRVLQPNVLFDFNEVIIDSILKHKYELVLIDENSNSVKLSNDDIIAINNEFISKENYKVLLGKSDFARSFVTAEWLYNSLGNSKNIDFTSIALGYLKSVEQFLFGYVSMHTIDRDSKMRKLSYFDLTKENLVENNNDISLGTLTGFISSKRNKDLYNEFVNKNIAQYIRCIAHKVKSDRNNHLHRENLKSIEEVDPIRDDTYMFFYIMLSCLRISDDEMMNDLLKDKENDIDKLYNYLYKNVRRRYTDIDSQLSNNYLIFPVFYLIDKDKEIGPYNAKKYHNFDDFGKKRIRFTKNGVCKSDIPLEIVIDMEDFNYIVKEKKLMINRMNREETISDDYLVIYDGSKFLLD